MDQVALRVNKQVTIVPVFSLQEVTGDGIPGFTDDEVTSSTLECRRVCRSELSLEDLIQPSVGELPQCSPEMEIRDLVFTQSFYDMIGFSNR